MIKKDNLKLLLAATLGLLLSLVAIYLVNQKLLSPNKTTSLTTPITNSQVGSEEVVVIILTKIDATTYKLSLLPKNDLALSALSIRFLVSQLATFTANPTLTATDWIFPINKIEETNNNLTLDISAVNTAPKGHEFSSELILGTIVSNSPLTMSIDKSETKILDKSALELNYIVEEK